MGPLRSASRPPAWPERTASTSARIETAVSAGVCAPRSIPAGPASRSSSSSSSPPRAGARAASPGCAGSRSRRRRTPRRQRGGQRGHVEPLLVREHDDGVVAVRSQAAPAPRPATRRRARPGSAAARGSRAQAAGRPRRCASRGLRGAAELLGGVDRADDQQARRRAEHLREDRLAAELEHAARPRLDLARPDHAPLAGPLALENRQRDRGLARLGQLALEALDEDVDLPTARQADVPGHVVGDPVGEQPRLAVLDHLGGLDGDVALDATAGNGARKLTASPRPRAWRQPAEARSGASRPRSPGRSGRPGPAALDAFRELSHARRVSLRRCGAAAGRTRG